ncbi:MAG: cell division protein CrgA [Acidimicrobiales bacterium]
MAKAKSKNARPAPKSRPAKAAARPTGETEEAARPSRTSAKDAAARAVAKPVARKAGGAGAGGAADKTSATGDGPKADLTKKSGPRPRPAPTKRTTPPASARYTPPVPKAEKISPIWVPIVMFACLGIGMLMIILNYVNVLPGPDPSNVYLMIGLGLITVGFITATKFH